MEGRIHWCAKKKTPVAKKMSLPQKSNSHNIKLYDFNLNMIHFILIFYKKIFSSSLIRIKTP